MWKKIRSKLVIIYKNAKLLGLLPKTDKDFLKEYDEHLTLRDFSRIKMQSKLEKKWADYIVTTIITIELFLLLADNINSHLIIPIVLMLIAPLIVIRFFFLWSLTNIVIDVKCSDAVVDYLTEKMNACIERAKKLEKEIKENEEKF